LKAAVQLTSGVKKSGTENTVKRKRFSCYLEVPENFTSRHRQEENFV